MPGTRRSTAWGGHPMAGSGAATGVYRRTPQVGKPSTPMENRPAINCGVWRLTIRPANSSRSSPTARRIARGLDFDERGEAFIHQLCHPSPLSRRSRCPIPADVRSGLQLVQLRVDATCADHVHWDTTERWSDIRRRGVTSTTDEAGGGHARWCDDLPRRQLARRDAAARPIPATSTGTASIVTSLSGRSQATSPAMRRIFSSRTTNGSVVWS